MGSSVQLKQVTVITPSDQTPSCVLSLSALDSQLFLRFTIEYLLVYNPRPGSDPISLTNRVKSAIARALVAYYPLSGRVKERSDGSGLEVNCRGQGAVFVEAVSDHHTCEDFDTPPRHVSSWRQLLSLHVADVLEGAPPLVLQLTWLKDGGATLAVGFNHCICDGIGSAEFLNFFTESTRNDSDSFSELASRKHVWDRHIFNQSPYDSVSHPEFSRVEDLCGFSDRFSSERLVPTSTVFDAECLAEMKKLAIRLGDSTYTSFEVLSAHVWRSWARSLNLPSNQTLKLLFSINVRDRVKPSPPAGFYGNSFVLGCAQTTAGELSGRGLAYGSTLVRRAKERVDEDYVDSVVGAVGGESRACPDSVGVLVLSQWSRLGLEKIDFGMGKPVQVGSVCCDRYCLFLPVPGQTDSVKVMVAVPSSAVDVYENLVKMPFT